MPRKRRHRTWLGLALMWALALLVFGLWPHLDLFLSRLFWSPETGFHWKDLAWVKASYRAEPVIGRGILVVMFVLLAVHHLGVVRPNRRRWRMAVAVVLSSALASGLVVEEGLKNNWGRARPAQVVEFGGELAYTAPLRPSAACPKNCSMPSGHATGAFLLMSLGVLAPLRRRRFWLAVGIGAGLVVGLGRVMQGAHFVSDIVFSGLIAGLCCTALRTVWVTHIAWRRGAGVGREHRPLVASINPARPPSDDDRDDGHAVTGILSRTGLPVRVDRLIDDSPVESKGTVAHDTAVSHIRSPRSKGASRQSEWPPSR